MASRDYLFNKLANDAHVVKEKRYQELYLKRYRLKDSSKSPNI